MHILLQGHRGTGKTTVGRLLAEQLDRPFVDLDELIEEETGRTCAEIVAEDEASFRETEIRTLARATELAERDTVYAVGGGFTSAAPALRVWLHRDGWEETAREDRQRLRPELEWEEEVAWMRETREPAWGESAHIRYVIPRGRTAERAAGDLATFARMAENPGPLADRSWFTPASADQLERACEDVERFGVAGVEVRSDVFASWKQLETPTLASLRTRSADWLSGALAEADRLDVDVQLIDFFRDHGGFDATPRPLLLSSHPSQVDPDDVEELVLVGRCVQYDYPQWSEHLILKYAPEVKGIGEVGLAHAMFAPVGEVGVATTFLPQGFLNAWCRPLGGLTNRTNYIGVGLRPSRYDEDASTNTPWDIQDWLPHLTAPQPQGFDALLGFPAHPSQGDLWHRRAALEREEPYGYVKVDARPEEFDAALQVLYRLGVRGVSVTSPHKRNVTFVKPNDADYGKRLSESASEEARRAEFPVRIGNTLVRRHDGWLATDTDRAGMTAALEWLEEREIGPGTVAVYGQGGVSPALVDAIEASDWFLVYHASAREGWDEHRPPFVTLVVNAAGTLETSRENPPKSRAWLDLHYVDVAAPPDGVVHLNGDLFFDAQAEAQRAFWNDLTEDD